MTDPALAAWLRRERKELRGWSQLEMARRLIRAARESEGEDPVPGTASIKRRIQTWENEGGVSLRYRRLYCRAFGIGLPQFGSPTDTALPALAPAPAMRPAPGRVAGREPSVRSRRSASSKPPTSTGRNAQPGHDTEARH